jgi:hypothetical protein
MGFRNHCKYWHNAATAAAAASLSSPQFDANPFLLPAAMCPIYRPYLTSPAWRIDGISATTVEICRIFESN